MTPLFEAETLLNEKTASSQQSLALTALADGRIVAVFVTGDPATEQSLALRLFNSDGTPAAPEAVGSAPWAATHEAPQLVPIEAGGFAMVYADSGVDGANPTAWLRLVNRDGVGLGEPVALNKLGLTGAALPRITVLADGSLLASWTDYSASDTDTSGGAVRARRISSEGVPLGDEFGLNETTDGDQTTPDLVALSGGGFIAVWTDASATGDDTDGTAIRARVFSADGTAKSGDILVNTGVLGDQAKPRVFALQNGRIFVAWEDNSAGHTNIKGQILNADGSVFGNEISLADGADNQSEAAFIVLADGRIAMVYRDDHDRGAGGEGADILLRILNDDGSFASGEIRVNDTATGEQSRPAITLLPDGRVMIGWTDASLSPDDPDGTALRGRIIDPRNAAVSLSGTRGQDQMIGTAWSDLLDGSDGNDTLAGRGGDDRISGEDGNDILSGDDGNDRLWGGEGNDILAGGRGADVLDSGNGNDRLDGGIGEDVLRGGAGNDVYVIDNVRDRIIESALASGGADLIESAFLSINLYQYVGIENAKLLSPDDGQLIGNGLSNRLETNAGNDAITAGAGNDRLIGLAGNDTLYGEAGNDRLIGGIGVDRLAGGTGRDVFAFFSAAETLYGIGLPADTITDFTHHYDRLDFSAFMDGGRFIGSAGFTGRADQVRYNRSTGMLYGDLNGDRLVDWHLRLQNKPLLDAFDFAF